MKRILSVLCVLIMGIAAVTGTAPNAKAATMSATAGKIATASGSLRIRSGSSTGASVVSSAAKGSYITLLSKSGSFWYVEYQKGKYGYAHADYIQTVSSTPATVQLQSGYLNVRSGAGTANTAVGRLVSGEVVLVLSAANGWSRILWHGTKTGYVSSAYLRTAQASPYTAVALHLPYYKQTDARWANTVLGSSGKTIAKSGCTTTAIAMMESYRTGTQIYPNAMAKKLSYTAGGDVYWPSNYQAVAGSSGYLSGIYNLLKQGKPVLFGAKKATGSQHWVVITGYTGGSTLTASGFTIHDPGSEQRTNLQQHLNNYPTVYKYFYYK